MTQPISDAVTQIFRLVHTLKGTCGFLGLERLQSIAHSAETLIDTLREGAPPTATAVSLLLQAMDRIKHLVARVGELEAEPAGDDRDVTDKIAAYLRGEPGGESTGSHEPELAPSAPAEASQDIAGTKRAKGTKRAERKSAHSAGARENPATAVQPAKAEPAREEGVRTAKEAGQAAAKEKAPDTIRISVETIQRIMDLVSELVLTRNQIMELSHHRNFGQMKTPLERLSTVTSDLQDAVMKARMQPLARLFASVPRMIRELSVELQKKYNLRMDGADTELDRQLIETIRDPLMHLVRNCADHGIESPQDRIAAGKPEEGEISIAAFHESGQVHIEIADDGRGMDADRIREKAVERGLGTPKAIAQMSEDEVFRFILEPGFSMATAITKISGRGVGMDVVRANIEAIGGTISMRSAKGRGSTFILKIPLTLAIAPALVVSAGGQRFAVPQQYVVEAVNVDDDSHALQKIQNAQVLQLRDELIPVAALAAILELPESNIRGDKLVVVLGLRGKKFGIIVDEIADLREIVVKPLGPFFANLKVFAGNTILGDGSVILIIDPAGVAEVLKVEKNSEAALAYRDKQSASAAGSNLILFKAGSGAAKVLPQSAVSRIVRAPAGAISKADGHCLYRYQDRLIPVFSVDDAGRDSDSCLILVISLHGKTFGLRVQEVLDIIENTDKLQLISNSPGVIGIMDLHEEAVEFIDAGYYYRMAYPYAQHASGTARINLLIIDGELGAHDILSPILASAGYEVTAVETVEQANEVLRHTNFGVILLDSKSHAALGEAEFLHRPGVLCLILDDSRNRPADARNEDGVVIGGFDRHRLLKAISNHLDTLPSSNPKAANLNLAQSGQNVSCG